MNKLCNCHKLLMIPELIFCSISKDDGKLVFWFCWSTNKKKKKRNPCSTLWHRHLKVTLAPPKFITTTTLRKHNNLKYKSIKYIQAFTSLLQTATWGLILMHLMVHLPLL